MSSQPVVPMFDPTGTLRDVPQAQMLEARRNGMEIGVRMSAPDGTTRVVPASRYQEASQNGMKPLPIEQQAVQHPGVLGSIWSDIKGMASSLPSMMGAMVGPTPVPVGGGRIAVSNPGGQIMQATTAADAQRAQEGRSPLYRAGAAVAGQFTNVPGMEQSAREGDVGGVVGHAASGPLAMAATIGAAKAAPALIEPPLRAASGLVKAGTEAVGEAREALTAPQNLAPEQAFAKATKPRNAIVDAQGKFRIGLPDARRAADSLGIDTSQMTLEDAQAAVSQAKRDVWSEFESRFMGPNRRIGIDTTPVADKVQAASSRWSDITKQSNPGAMEDIANRAGQYDGKIQSIDQVERRIQDLNNELRSQQAQYKVNEDALRRDPRYASRFAELDGLRAIEDKAFTDLSGPGSAGLKQRYGALKTMDDVLQRRVNVADRSAPISLNQAMGRIYGLGRIAKGAVTLSPSDVLEGLVSMKAGENARLYNDPNYLVQQAFSKTLPRAAAPKPIARPTAGLLPRGPIMQGGIPDTSGSIPYQPPAYSPTTRAQRLGLMLPEKTAIEAGPVPEEPMQVLKANYKIVRDPKTGRMRKMYLTSGKP